MEAQLGQGQGQGQGRLFSDTGRQPEPLCILSYGGGQDSTAILLKLIEDPAFKARWAPGRLACVMSDTGDEHPHTLRYVGRMRRLCEDRGLEFHFLTAGGPYHSDAWPDLISQYRKNNTVGSKAFPKACSAQLKVNVFYRFLEALLSQDYGVSHGRKQGLYEYTALTGEPIRVLLGIAAGEETRISEDDSSPPWMKRTIERRYPLVELGWDRLTCQNYILSCGQPLPAPSWCRRCPFKGEEDLVLMEREDPEGLAEWVELEKAKLAAATEKFPDLPPEKNLGVFKERTLPQALADAKERYGHLTDEELDGIRMAGHGVRSCY